MKIRIINGKNCIKVKSQKLNPRRYSVNSKSLMEENLSVMQQCLLSFLKLIRCQCSSYLSSKSLQDLRTLSDFLMTQSADSAGRNLSHAQSTVVISPSRLSSFQNLAHIFFFTCWRKGSATWLPRVHIRVWLVRFQLLVIPSKEGGRKIGNISWGYSQILKKTRRIENIIKVDNP